MRLLLQRRLETGDCNKWRTVARFERGYAALVMSLVTELATYVEPLTWRVVKEDQCHEPLAQWDKTRGWYE